MELSIENLKNWECIVGSNKIIPVLMRKYIDKSWDSFIKGLRICFELRLSVHEKYFYILINDID